MASAREYFVLENEDDKRVLTNSPARFSWPALIFPHFWTLYHRTWLLAVGAWLLLFAVTAAATPQGENLTIAQALLALTVGICWLLFGFHANRLLYLNLAAQGWRYIGAVSAVSKEDALAAAAALPTGEPVALPAPYPVIRSLVWVAAIFAGYILISFLLGVISGLVEFLRTGTIT